jgi:3',5'-cyclic-AMP phosphodiesterase
MSNHRRHHSISYVIHQLRPALLLGGLIMVLMITILSLHRPIPTSVQSAPMAPIPVASKGLTEGTLLRFTVMSDLHVQDFDKASHSLFRGALKDAMEQTPTSKLLVLNGDITNGEPKDYDRVLRLLAEQNHPPVEATMGNHEYYKMWTSDYKKLSEDWSSALAVQLFDSHFNYTEPYHEQVVEGFPFLFLSGEAYRDVDPGIAEDAWLSDKQLNWLQQRLEFYRSSSPAADGESADSGRKPLFVFLHQPLPGTTDGSSRERGVVQHEALKKLLEAYSDVFLFSGHTHWDAESTQQVWHSGRGGLSAIGIASVRDVLDKRDQSTGLSESAAVEVRTDAVVIRFREHTHKRWIGEPVVIPYGSK